MVYGCFYDVFFWGEGVLTYVSISASRAQKNGESDAKSATHPKFTSSTLGR